MPKPTSRQRVMPRWRLATMVLSASLSSGAVLAACSSTSTQPTPSTVPVRPVTPTPARSAPASSSASSTASGPSRCRSTGLSVTVGHPNGAAGSVGYVVTFHDTSGASCVLFGYPGLQLLASDGSALPTQVHRGVAATVPPVPEHAVVLDPGSTASFVAGFATATGYGSEHCPRSTSVQVTPPDAYHAVVVPWAIAPYGGTTEHLQCGDVTVSPVYAGSGPPAS